MSVCDPGLGGHAARVGAHAELIARRLGWDDERVEDLRLGAALHDVGKVSIHPEVLQKPGALDEDEIAHIRAHPVEGAWLISGVRSLAPALPYVLFHHERWDGTGYPTRRSGSEIPIEGRILAVADAFDAMTSTRHYRSKLNLENAKEQLISGSGTQFDKTVVDLFIKAVVDHFQAVMEEFEGSMKPV